MGVAEEFDEEEGPLDEHINRLTDAEKQVEVLKAALEAEKKKSASGDFCQIEKCTRHVDLWCDACETPMCYRCSTAIVCEAAESHSLEEFGVIYKDVKGKFLKWRDEQEEKFLVVELRQRKMMDNIRGKERELSEASGESLSMRADRLVEIAELIKKLEPLSLQVEELQTNLTTYGEDVDKLSKPEYLCVVKSVVKLLDCDATVSSNLQTTNVPLSEECTKPISLQLISKHGTDSTCWSVHHDSVTGDVLVGCRGGVKIVSRQSGEITHLADYKRAIVRENKGEVFIASGIKETVNVFKFNMIDSTDELLFSFSYPNVPQMAVSDRHIVVVGKGNKVIEIYNRVSGTLSTVQLPDLSVMYGLHFLSDQTLLATGEEEDKRKLNRYRLSDEGELTLIWSCDGVDSLQGGISVAENGLIFVCGFRNKTVCIVAIEGEIHQKIKCEVLSGWCKDISIRENELAVSHDDDGFCLYKII